METVDFARSFLTFRIDYLKRQAETASHEPPSSLNNARILLECICTVEDSESGKTLTFVMGVIYLTQQVGSFDRFYSLWAGLSGFVNCFVDV